MNGAGPAAVLRERAGFRFPARWRKQTFEGVGVSLLEFVPRRAPFVRAREEGMAAARESFSRVSRPQTVEQLYARAVREGQAACTDK